MNVSRLSDVKEVNGHTYNTALHRYLFTGTEDEITSYLDSESSCPMIQTAMSLYRYGKSKIASMSSLPLFLNKCFIIVWYRNRATFCPNI